jgi:hypothetical protein
MTETAAQKTIRLKCACAETRVLEEKVGIAMIGNICDQCGSRISLGQDPVPEPAAPVRTLTSDERIIAMLCHLLAFLSGFVGPIVLWAVKKDESPFVDAHGKEAINFHITVLIYSVVTLMLCFVLVGFLLIPVVGLLAIISPIVGAVKAANGQPFRYPLAIRLIR